MLQKAANNAKSHVFGSVKASIILPTNSQQVMRDADGTNCSFLKCLFSIPVWFSLVVHTQHERLNKAMITYFDTSDCLCPFVLGQKPSVCWRVWEQETVAPIREWKKRLRDVRGAHENNSAVISVSIPVIIISLEEGRCIGDMLNLVVPLPWLKPCCMNVQCAKADETSNNLS